MVRLILGGFMPSPWQCPLVFLVCLFSCHLNWN